MSYKLNNGDNLHIQNIVKTNIKSFIKKNQIWPKKSFFCNKNNFIQPFKNHCHKCKHQLLMWQLNIQKNIDEVGMDILEIAPNN
jgi:hypothetical protein